MRATVLRRLGLLLAALCWCAVARGEEPLRSGPQPGETLPGSFEPLNVTGEYAGEHYCLVCAAGLQPEVMIFARTVNAPLFTLLERLEAAVGQHEKAGLGAFAVILSEADGLEKQLRDEAEKHHLKQVLLAIDSPDGPDGYALAKDADVTVVLYVQHEVRANHALRRDQLDSKAIDRILADLPKILPAEKAGGGDR